MSTYADFITKCRADVGDFGMRQYETADGDGATLVFQLQSPKVLESSYTIQISSVTKTETTHYTLDKNTGTVVFVTAPAAGNDTVSFAYQQVNQLDADWLDIINQVLQQLRRKLWIEGTNESALDTVADQNDYALSGVAADIIHLLDVEYRVSSTDPWRSVRATTNAVFYKDLQKLHLRPAFTTGGYDIRLRFNRAYVQGTATSDSFEVQQKYWPVIRQYCKALYLERQAMAMTKEKGAVSKEKAFETSTELLRLAQVTRQAADAMLKQVRPQKPALAIPQAIDGVRI